VSNHSEAFVAFDTSKLRNAVAIAEAGRTGEVRFLGEIDTTEAATIKFVKKLAGKHARLTFCYEAGPTGYGLQRLIESLGHDCIVVAPSLIPKKAGDRVKTNRRDALDLARQLRAGELTAVWVPDERHEAMRDLTRAREAAVDDLQSKRRQVLSLLLRLGRYYPGKRTWTKAHMNWLASQKLEHAEQRIAFEEMLLAVRQAQQRIARLEQAIRAAVPDWSLAQTVTALMAMRGFDLVSASALLAELGDLTRFQTPRELMGYLGLVPSEHSSGDKVKRSGITKAGNRRARRILVECSWSYRHPPRIGQEKLAKVAAAPRAVKRSPGRRSRVCVDASGHWPEEASDRPSWSPRSPVNSQASSGRSIGKSPPARPGPPEPTFKPIAGGAWRRGNGPANIRYRAMAGAKPRQGNSRFRCVADHAIDARAKTGTAPDEHSELRLKSAHQSLITDVSRLRPYRCTIIFPTHSSDNCMEQTACARYT
jgi:transposase